jgi:hypothetical protein
MIAQTPRDPWRTVWRIATGDGWLAILLLALAAGLTITTLLPQMPSDSPVAYARWLSETQARLGRATPALQTLGLFTVTRSLGFRTLLALTAACLALRLIEIGSRLRRKWAWADLFPTLAHAGTLVLLAGLLVTHLWGWQATGVVVLGDERVALPGTAGWLALDQDTLRVSHSAGLATFVEARGPAIRARAIDNSGQVLSLRQAPESDPLAELSVALTEDRYFAIPDAQLVVRLTLQPGQHLQPDSPVLVQVYRSPPGELATEAVMEGSAEVTVDNVTLHLTRIPYAKVTATFNPGSWPTGAGIVLLAVGLLGDVALVARRFRQREKTEGQAPLESEEA